MKQSNKTLGILCLVNVISLFVILLTENTQMLHIFIVLYIKSFIGYVGVSMIKYLESK